MANKYFTQLTQLTAGSVASGDALAIEDISAGETKYITALDIATYLSGLVGAGGWTSVGGTWTYASAATITVPSGAASIYNKGMPIRWKQGGGYKYGNISAVADTTLTIFTNTDYTVANSAITDMYYATTPMPLDFPQFFNYTSTVSGSGGSIGTYAETLYASKYRVLGTSVQTLISKLITNKGSWSGSLIVLRPVSVTPFTSFTSLGGGVWAGGALAPKAYLNEADSGSYYFSKTMVTANIQWSDLATSDVIVINTTSPF
jgi:hypothetical protein